MNRMHTGEFQMAPLSDFTVTFTDHTRKPDVAMLWVDWMEFAGFPHYDVTGNTVIVHTKKPVGINIIMPHNNPPYKLEFSQ